MEFGNKNQGGGGGGFMKSKLVMSFYRAPKPSSGVGKYATKVEQEPCWAVQQVSLSKPPAAGGAGGGGFPSWDDGYVHGPRGISGDEQVDTKATSYICQVKERRRLEEVNMADEGLPLQSVDVS